MADPETDTQAQAEEELIFGKYKTLEDAQEAYKSAERKLHEQAQQIRERDEQIESLSDLAATLQQTPQQYPQQTADHPLIAEYEQAMEQMDYRRALAIQAQVATLAAQQAAASQFQQQVPQWNSLQQNQDVIAAEQATQYIKSVYPDFDEEAIASTIESRPELARAIEAAHTPQDYASLFDSAYKLAKYDDLAKMQQQAQQAEAQKLAAQTASGAGPGRVMAPDEAKSEWDRIRAAGGTSPWTS